jgi:hypothetical protein
MHPDSVDDDATCIWTRALRKGIINMQRFPPKAVPNDECLQ